MAYRTQRALKPPDEPSSYLNILKIITHCRTISLMSWKENILGRGPCTHCPTSLEASRWAKLPASYSKKFHHKNTRLDLDHSPKDQNEITEITLNRLGIYMPYLWDEIKMDYPSVLKCEKSKYQGTWIL